MLTELLEKRNSFSEKGDLPFINLTVSGLLATLRHTLSLSHKPSVPPWDFPQVQTPLCVGTKRDAGGRTPDHLTSHEAFLASRDPEPRMVTPGTQTKAAPGAQILSLHTLPGVFQACQRKHR